MDESLKLSEQLTKISEQLEYVLVLQAKCVDDITTMKKDLEFLSSNMATMQSKVQSINAKLNDNDLNIDKIDDQLQEIHNQVSTIPNEFQQLTDSITNMKFYNRQRNNDIITA